MNVAHCRGSPSCVQSTAAISSNLAALPSWAIRFVALLGLSRVCRVCSRMHLKDGLSAVAWGRLMEAHAAESDKRVMEAYKLRQVGVAYFSCGSTTHTQVLHFTGHVCMFVLCIALSSSVNTCTCTF